MMGYEREEMIGKTSTELNLWTNPAGEMQIVGPIQQQGLSEIWNLSYGRSQERS